MGISGGDIQAHGAPVVGRAWPSTWINRCRWNEPRVTVVADGDIPTGVVDIVVARGADQTSVVQVGFTAPRPVFDVMYLVHDAGAPHLMHAPPSRTMIALRRCAGNSRRSRPICSGTVSPSTMIVVIVASQVSCSVVACDTGPTHASVDSSGVSDGSVSRTEVLGAPASIPSSCAAIAASSIRSTASARRRPAAARRGAIRLRPDLRECVDKRRKLLTDNRIQIAPDPCPTIGVHGHTEVIDGTVLRRRQTRIRFGNAIADSPGSGGDL